MGPAMKASQAIETVEGAGRVEYSEAPIFCRSLCMIFVLASAAKWDVSKVPHN